MAAAKDVSLVRKFENDIAKMLNAGPDQQLRDEDARITLNSGQDCNEV